MKTILDLGCGTGDRAAYCKKMDNFIGIDIDTENISIAQKKFPNAKWIKSDITKIDIKKIPNITNILCIEVIEHIPNWQDVFKTIQCAPQNTRLTLTTPHHLSEKKLKKKNPTYWSEIGHVNEFTKKQLYQELTKTGWKDICIRRTNAALYFELSRLFRKKAPCIRNTYYQNILGMPEKLFWLFFRSDLFHTKLLWFFPIWMITLPIAYLVLNPLFGATWYVKATKK